MPEMKGSLNTIRKLFLSKIVGDYTFVRNYKQLKTDEERFSFALKPIVNYSTFLLDSKCEEKSSEHSIRSRQAGNDSFVASQYYAALKEYTESILYAIDSSEELAIAYANRSAALFKLNKHEECINDIDRALDLKYPDRLKSKLYKRKGLCLTALRRPGAVSSFQGALIWLDKTTRSETEIKQMENELKGLISASSTIVKPLEKVMQNSLPKIVSTNSELPSASDAVELKYSKEYGRHLVATRKIKPGEILAVEKPYCMRVFSRNIHTHCSYCLQVSWNMIPCKHCVNVAYCSEACKSKAWEEYHEIECPVIGLLLGLDIEEMLWMSLRMAIMATRKGTKLDALKEELINVDRNIDPRTKGFSDDGKFHYDKYRSVYSLTTNVDKCSIDKLIIGAIWAALTTCVLARETKIFGKKLKLNTLAQNPNVLFLGALMLRQNYIIFINMHSFGATRSSNTCEHGHALMATCSLVNHSCDANTIRQWFFDHMVLYAAYPIEQGEPIFDNYGPHYFVRVKSERERALWHWNFNCRCLACKENWPLLDDLPSYKKQSLTRENKMKIEQVLQELVTIHRCVIEQGIKENMPILLNILLKAIETLFPLVKKPCRELASAALMLEELYAIADATYDYEQLVPSIAETEYLISYLCFQHSFSEN